MILGYKYRIEPNKGQAEALSAMLGDFCDLYNAALEQRALAYRTKRITLRYLDQAAELKATRASHEGLARWSFTTEQQILRRLEKAFSGFYGRLQKGAKIGGLPRFRSLSRFNSAEFRVSNGLCIRKSGRITFVGVPGEIRVRWHREMPCRPKSAILMRQGGKWYVVFNVEVNGPSKEAKPLDTHGNSVGIDLGLNHLVATSDGELIKRPNVTKRYASRLRRHQRARARSQRKSSASRKRRERVASTHRKIVRVRSDYLHKVSAYIARRYARIGIESLNVAGMASGMLAKHVNDAAWAQLMLMMTYKAARAGAEIVSVDPRGTSQTCPGCGAIARKTLRDRIHSCDCGCVLDRDVAAAMVIHHRAFGFWPGAGHETLSGSSGTELVSEVVALSNGGSRQTTSLFRPRLARGVPHGR